MYSKKVRLPRDSMNSGEICRFTSGKKVLMMFALSCRVIVNFSALLKQLEREVELLNEEEENNQKEQELIVKLFKYTLNFIYNSNN